MTCDELKDFCELYTMGVLEEPERSELDEHLKRRCAVCEQRMRQALETGFVLASMAPPVEPPRRLRRRVLASVGYEKQGWFWGISWGPVMAALVVGLLWFSVQDRRKARELSQIRDQLRQSLDASSRSQAELKNTRLALAMLNDPETRLVTFGKKEPAPPKGRVLAHAAHGVVLFASNLPPAPSGKLYEMWVIPKGKSPKPAGMFQTDPNGWAMHIDAEPFEIAGSAVAVTLEPEAGSAAPTSTPLFVAAL